MRQVFVITDHDLTEKIVGRTDAKAINLARALVFKADELFGRDGWRMKSDTSIPGFYAVASDGRCLTIDVR